MSPKEKILKLAGFQPIVSEAQAYQILRNLNKSIKKVQHLNRLMCASQVVYNNEKIKVGSYFFYQKFKVPCGAVSKDGTKKTKFASRLRVLSKNVVMYDVYIVCLEIIQRSGLTPLEKLSASNKVALFVAEKKYEEAFNFLQGLPSETQENSTVRT